MKVFLLCAGHERRWNKELAPKKCLLRAEDEAPLWARTAAQCVIGQAPLQLVLSADIALGPHIDHGIVIEEGQRAEGFKLTSSSVAWNVEGRTVLLFGDVWFSDAAITLILEYPHQDTICFFGRKGPSKLTGKPYGEIFAISFYPQHHSVLKAIRGVDHAMGWNVFRLLEKMSYPDLKFVEIDDWTEDFDTAEDYHRWLKARSAVKKP